MTDRGDGSSSCAEKFAMLYQRVMIVPNNRVGVRGFRSYPKTNSNPDFPQSQRLAAREGRIDYLLVGSTGVSESLPAAETRLGRRTALTFPLLPPPQKN